MSLNWWGSNADPSSKVSGVTITPWLILTSTSTPKAVGTGGKSTIITDLLHDSGILTDPTNPNLYYHDPILGHVPDGIITSFLSDARGSVSPIISSTLNGAASTQFTAFLSTGLSTVTSTIDTQLTTATVNIVTSLSVTSTDPAYNAVNIAINKVIKIVFNRNIMFGTNPWIELKLSSGSGTIPFTPTISGNILTIKPNILLAYGTKYTVILHSGSIQDTNGVVLSSPYITRFTTMNSKPTPPVVVRSDPVNNAVNIATSKLVKFTFNKTIKLGTNPWIEFKTTSGVAKKFTTTVSGSTLSLKPTTALAKATSYIVILHSNSVTDSTGLSGLASPYMIRFKTA